MTVSSTLTLNTGGGGIDVTKSVTITDEFRIDSQFTVGGAVSDELHTLSLDVSEARMVYIVSTTAITMKWNDSGGAQGDILFVANEPVLWWSTQKTDGGSTLNPLGTVDITATYWTNGSGTDATVSIKIIYDGSP